MVAVCTNDRNLSFVPTHKYRARGWTSYKYRFSSLQCDVIGPGIEPISFSGSQARSQVLRFGGTKYIFNEAKFLFLLYVLNSYVQPTAQSKVLCGPV